MDFRGCCHWLPWKSAGFHGKGHGSWCFHGKCHGCGHGTCRGSVRGKLRGINHGNPRKSAAIATAISAYVKQQQFPRPSAAIRSHCHGSPPIRGNYHGSPRHWPRQFPRAPNHSNFHGHPRQLPRQSSDKRQLTQTSAAIATAISADVKPQQFSRPSAAIVTALLRYVAIATEVRGNRHGNPRGR